MAVILYVRIKSGLDPDELERRALERKPRFKEIPGLIQKVYGREPQTGEVCGIYFFKDLPSMQAFKETELAKTIPSAYEALDVRREVYELMFPLYEERGPF
ncbi:YdhR family protein [Vibrio fluvialis]|nr:YdhR family protein [Vibrio fluvialis]